MRKLFVLPLTALLLALAGPASATTVLPWTGQGSENLPCETGGHWVLTGHGITSASMVVDGTEYVMAQSGNGSFSADSTGEITDSTVAAAAYEGSARNPQFVMSHCADGPTPPPPTTPPPTSPPPTSPPPCDNGEDDNSCATWTPTWTPTPPIPCQGACDAPSGLSTVHPQGTAFTGSNVVPATVAGLGLVAIGLACLWYARRKV